MIDSQTFRLDGQLALVTGSSTGIGLALARGLAQAGARVVLNGRDTQRLASAQAALRGEGLAIESRAFDVCDPAATEAAVAGIEADFGALDVLVNNAGIAGGYGPLKVVDGEMLARLWAVNITGAFLCAREAVARMHGGNIVNVSSKASVLGGSGEWVFYAASKGALDTMTIGLSKELAEQRIRVNGVRPGLIESDFHLHAPPGRIERMRPTVPMQRSGTADEVAAAVLWLASSAASYVTGTFIDVAGGR